MPYVAIDMPFGHSAGAIDHRPGRTPAQKPAFVDAVSSALAEFAGIAREDICVIFRETGQQNYFCGGRPISPLAGRPSARHRIA